MLITRAVVSLVRLVEAWYCQMVTTDQDQDLAGGTKHYPDEATAGAVRHGLIPL